ncbi:hypothetical protein ABZ896_11290 [Streptomyces sp. NPDC047072]|uniref:hypothetical protein n=1 Tax=Streptomyces sp. NPDC047072 TaxID=3154809 RepID=UPI00340A68E5
MKTLLAPTVLRPQARLVTRATGSRPPALAGEAPVQPKVRGGAAELRARREADLQRALARLADTGTAVRVGRYSLVVPRQDPADRLAETQAVVHRRRWTDAITTFDDTGAGDPALRPQMARLFAALDAGEIHGIVAVSQIDISPFPDIYADTLAVLRARGGFLALARSETSI